MIRRNYQNEQKIPATDWNGKGIMKNPLRKRIPRELKGELEYLVVFPADGTDHRVCVRLSGSR